MGLKDALVIGTVAAVGFTVALFVTSVALSNGVSPEAAAEYAKYGTADMLRLGALLSFAAGPIAWLFAKMLNVGRYAESS